MMEQLKAERGLPKQVRVDNGPELVSSSFADWCEEHGIEVVCIQKGKPQQSGFAEHFNGSFGYEFLDAHLFESVSQLREMTWLWRLETTTTNDRMKVRGICHPVCIGRSWKL